MTQPPRRPEGQNERRMTRPPSLRRRLLTILVVPLMAALTRQIVEAGKALKIAVHDHLVVGREGVASFKALGLM